ncbi:MAG: hypothetical protein GX635_07775, partial [Synergistaceae bacterium]|nr:hypothetical protein [Synergistaceae bacterium]
MSMAVLKLANGEYMLPNVKEIELHEYDAGRVEQTRFFWEHGNEVEDYIASTKVADIWAAAVDQEMARIANLRKNMLIDNEQTRRYEERMTFAKVAAVFAQWDAKTTAEKALKAQILERAMSDRQSNGPSKKAQPKDVNAVAADASAEAGVDIEFDPDTEDSDEVALSEGKELMPNEDRVLWFKRRFFNTYVETIKKNAEATWRVYDEFTRVKGGKVSIVEGDSYQAEISRGDDVLSFVDPPYVDTLGYSSWRRLVKDGKVSFELVEPSLNGVDLYEQTAGLLERLSNAGHGIVYTDESFTFAKVNKNGTIKRPKVLAGALPVYMRIQKNFDEIGSVKKLIGSGRMETIGIRAGGYDNAFKRQAESEKLAQEGGRGDGVPGADAASGRAGGERIQPENVAGDGSGSRTGEGMVLAGLPDAVGDGDSPGVQGAGREAGRGEVAGGDDSARGQPGRVEEIGLFAEHGSWGGGQAPGQGAGGRGGGGDQDVGPAEADAGGARSESDAAQRRYNIVADRLFAAVTGGLQAQIDAAQGRDAKQALVDAWKAENPERYAELEKMREAALKAAGYNVGPVWHGTATNKKGKFPFVEFKTGELGGLSREAGETEAGSFFTADEAYARGVGIYKSSWRREGKYAIHKAFYLRNPDVLVRGDKGQHTEYRATSPSQIKSSEPLSLDESGRLIPPSQWADEIKPDIRYSIVSDVTPEQDAAYLAAVEAGD